VILIEGKTRNNARKTLLFDRINDRNREFPIFPATLVSEQHFNRGIQNTFSITGRSSVGNAVCFSPLAAAAAAAGSVAAA